MDSKVLASMAALGMSLEDPRLKPKLLVQQRPSGSFGVKARRKRHKQQKLARRKNR